MSLRIKLTITTQGVFSIIAIVLTIAGVITFWELIGTLILIHHAFKPYGWPIRVAIVLTGVLYFIHKAGII